MISFGGCQSGEGRTRERQTEGLMPLERTGRVDEVVATDRMYAVLGGRDANRTHQRDGGGHHQLGISWLKWPDASGAANAWESTHCLHCLLEP